MASPPPPGVVELLASDFERATHCYNLVVFPSKGQA